MSHINGKGYGDAHDWRCEGTPYRVTKYRCAGCGVHFGHDYDTTPSIFKAIYQARVPSKCGDAESSVTEADIIAKERSHAR